MTVLSVRIDDLPAVEVGLSPTTRDLPAGETARVLTFSLNQRVAAAWAEPGALTGSTVRSQAPECHRHGGRVRMFSPFKSWRTAARHAGGVGTPRYLEQLR